MLYEEFIKLTGFHPSQDMYKVIEEAYLELNIDKRDFCRRYKDDTDGLASEIARRSTIASNNTKREHEHIMREHEEIFHKMEYRIKRLTDQLEREQEWQPYISGDMMPREDYDEIASSDLTDVLDDEHAKRMISKDFGFDEARIEIIHEIPVFEINRHKVIRQIGTEATPRDSLYASSDMNYFRFTVAGYLYEIHNGDLVRIFD